MRTVEFKSKIRDNQITISRRVMQELGGEQDKSVRIMVFLTDSDVYDDKAYNTKRMSKKSFSTRNTQI